MNFFRNISLLIMLCQVSVFAQYDESITFTISGKLANECDTYSVECFDFVRRDNQKNIKLQAKKTCESFSRAFETILVDIKYKQVPVQGQLFPYQDEFSFQFKCEYQD